MSKEIRKSEEELRIAKMISEGGPVLEQYFTFTFKEKADKEDKEEKKEKLKEEKMISEGGLGAEAYYNEDEKIAKKNKKKKED